MAFDATLDVAGQYLADDFEVVAVGAKLHALFEEGMIDPGVVERDGSAPAHQSGEFDHAIDEIARIFRFPHHRRPHAQPQRTKDPAH